MRDFSESITHGASQPQGRAIPRGMPLEHAIGLPPCSSSNFAMDNLKVFSELQWVKIGEI